MKAYLIDRMRDHGESYESAEGSRQINGAGFFAGGATAFGIGVLLVPAGIPLMIAGAGIMIYTAIYFRRIKK